MNYINLTPRDIQVLNEPLALDQRTMIGSDANDDHQGMLLIIPFNEIVSVRRGEDLDELMHSHDIVEVVVNTTEGEQTYWLYDYVVIN